MNATLRIRRLQPDVSPEPYWQEFAVAWEPGEVILTLLHRIHEDEDGTLAYRYSCRGAICGSCAMRINGVAGLACKTQLNDLDTAQPITLEPLLNLHVIKDLVVEQGPFFASLRRIMPWLTESRHDPDAPFDPGEGMSAQEADEFKRSADCIMCQSCFSDCPKRAEDESFLGPAACLSAFKRTVHPQEPDPEGRLAAAAEPGGVFDCDRHANCVKVCPKDCRPMRAIMMLQRRAEAAGLAKKGD